MNNGLFLESRREGRDYVKKLVNRERKDQANVTRILDLLEQRGYIKRTPDPKDKRDSLILLTNEGKKLTEELVPIDKKLQGIAIEGIKDEELDIFKSVLAKISHNVKKELNK